MQALSTECELKDVPDEARRALRAIGAWAAERGAGRRRKSGCRVLFHGPSRTGKTMAAAALGKRLGRPVFRIDLAQVVSKFIGETEKNIDAVFTEAEASGAILLFDAAEALFGRRTKVGDAHDRFANAEVGYLLQWIEGFEGIAILATNRRANLDPAFLRRMRFSISFPADPAGEAAACGT